MRHSGAVRARTLRVWCRGFCPSARNLGTPRLANVALRLFEVVGYLSVCHKLGVVLRLCRLLVVALRLQTHLCECGAANRGSGTARFASLVLTRCHVCFHGKEYSTRDIRAFEWPARRSTQLSARVTQCELSCTDGRNASSSTIVSSDVERTMYVASRLYQPLQ